MSLLTQAFKSIFQNTLYPQCVKSKRVTMFLYFDLNSKDIETIIMSTQITYESNHNSLLFESTKSSALIFCILSFLLRPKRKRSHREKNK